MSPFPIIFISLFSLQSRGPYCDFSCTCTCIPYIVLSCLLPSPSCGSPLSPQEEVCSFSVCLPILKIQLSFFVSTPPLSASFPPFSQSFHTYVFPSLDSTYENVCCLPYGCTLPFISMKMS